MASGFAVGTSPTYHKDKLHRCNLLLSGDGACVYVRKTPMLLISTWSDQKKPARPVGAQWSCLGETQTWITLVQ